MWPFINSLVDSVATVALELFYEKRPPNQTVFHILSYRDVDLVLTCRLIIVTYR